MIKFYIISANKKDLFFQNFENHVDKRLILDGFILFEFDNWKSCTIKVQWRIPHISFHFIDGNLRLFHKVIEKYIRKLQLQHIIEKGSYRPLRLQENKVQFDEHKINNLISSPFLHQLLEGWDYLCACIQMGFNIRVNESLIEHGIHHHNEYLQIMILWASTHLVCDDIVDVKNITTIIKHVETTKNSYVNHLIQLIQLHDDIDVVIKKETSDQLMK